MGKPLRLTLEFDSPAALQSFISRHRFEDGAVSCEPAPTPTTPPQAAIEVQSGVLDTDVWLFNLNGTEDPDEGLTSVTVDWGDGSSDTSVTVTGGAIADVPISHTFPAGAATYTITVTAVNTADQATTATVTVQVAVVTAAPVAALTFVSGDFTGDPVTVSTAGTADPDGTIAGYEMDWDDGAPVTGAGDPPATLDHTYATPGTYTATLTVTDNDGLEGSVTMEIVVIDPVAGDPPETTFSLLGGQYLGESFQFAIDGSDPDAGPVTWSLSFGDGTDPVTGDGDDLPATESHEYTAVGSYTAVFRMTDEEGLTTTKTVAVTVLADETPEPTNQSPIAQLAHVSGQFEGSPIVLSTAGTRDLDDSIAHYSMNWGDGLNAEIGTGAPPATLTHTYAVTGVTRTVNATLTVTDTGGLVATATIALLIEVVEEDPPDPPPPPPPQPPTAVLTLTGGFYLGDTFVFGLSGTFPGAPLQSWTLKFGDGSAQVTGSTLPASRTRVYTASGNYVATLTVTDTSGLTHTASLNVAVAVLAPPPPPGQRFQTLADRSERIVALSLRTMAEIQSIVNNSSHTVTSWSVDSVRGAAKLTYPLTQPSVSIGQQLRAAIRKTTGTVLVTWDAMYSREWMKLAFGGGYDYVTVPQYIHKEFQLGFDPGGLSNGTITYETQTHYRDGTMHYIGRDGTRLYGTEPPGWPTVTGTGTAAFWIPPMTWIRYVAEIRLNRPASEFTDWIAAGGTVVAGTTYHMITKWCLHPGLGPIRRVFRAPLTIERGDGISNWWAEHNTSSPNGALTVQPYIWVKDLVVLHNYTLPSTPENDSLIFERPPAGEYFVSPSGSDSAAGTAAAPWRTWAKARASATAGQTVVFRAGTYAETLNWVGGNSGSSWNDAITFRAYPGETVTVRPAAGAERVLHMHGSSAVATDAPRYLIFDGIVFDGVNVTRDVAKVTAWDPTVEPAQAPAHHIRFLNCTFKNATQGQGLLGTWGSVGCEVIGGRITNIDGPALGSGNTQGLYWSASDFLCDGLEVDNCWGFGISNINSEAGLNVSNHIIRRANVHDCGLGIPGGGSGINLGEGTGHLIMNCLSYRNTGDGIVLGWGSGSTGIKVYGNTVYDNDGYGLQIRSGNNTAVVKNNILYLNGAGNYLDSATGTTESNNSRTGTNPQFRNAGGGDFHLTSSTPGGIINGGTPLAELLVDYDGVNRANPPEIGAFER